MGYLGEPKLESRKSNQRRKVWTENNLRGWKNESNSLEIEWVSKP